MTDAIAFARDPRSPTNSSDHVVHADEVSRATGDSRYALSTSRRVPNPLEWSLLDRCLFVQGLSMPFVLAYLAICTLALRHPELGPFYRRDALVVARLALLGVGAVFGALALATHLARRSAREAPWIVHATVYVYSIANAMGAYALGPVTSPYPLVLIGAVVVGIVLFPPRIAWTGLALGLATMGTAEVLRIVGMLPYAPVLATSPFANGEVAPAWSVPMWAVVGTVSALVLGLFGLLMGRLRERERQLEALVRTDALTGLPNRRELVLTLGREHARSRRAGTKLACALVDVDHFKSVNDRFGHAVGDLVLRATAERLAAEVRSTDLVARFGGEEFVVLMTDTDLAGARVVAERCRAALDGADVMLPSGERLHVTASFGLAVMADAERDSPDDLLRRADDALYAAKAEGRNRVALASDAPTREATDEAGPAASAAR